VSTEDIKMEDPASGDPVYTQEIEVVVDPGQTPIRIDKFLFDRLEKISRNRIQEGVSMGAITVNEQTIKANYKVRPRDVILVRIPRQRALGEAVEPQDLPLDIVYEDETLLVVNKASGMVVHPGVGNFDGTLVNGLKYYLSNQQLPLLEGNTADRAGLVHRIDKDTSGLLVVAKTDEALAHLAKQFFDHTVERRYQSLVWGQPDEEEGTISVNIGRDLKNRTLRATFPDGREGKVAVTHYKLIEPMYYVSLVECVLETGRTHQIRVHMQHAGHPVFNDAKYGGARVVKGTVFQKYRLFVENCFKIVPYHVLHAGTLGFVHPSTGEQMHFEQPLPDNFQELLEKWRSYLASRTAGM